MYTLTYFAMPGRAEIARLIMEVGNIPYENEYVVFKDWYSSLKKSKNFTFGQIPVLSSEGFELCQSGAITRYLAKVAKLYPEDIRVASMAEMYLEGITEWRNKAYSIWFANDATEQSMDQYLTITVPFYLSVFEKAINENGYLSGDTLSFVDLALWDILKENKYETIYQSDKYPKLNQHYKMIGSLDKVEAYMNSTKRPPSIDEFLNGLN